MARFPTVSVEAGVEAVAVERDADHVLLTVRPVGGGPDRTIRARYLLAADGGSSQIRKMVGITLPGRHIAEQWFDIQLRAWYDRPADAPLDFTFLADPARPGVDCPCPEGYHRVEFRVNRGESVDYLRSDAGLRALLAERGIDADDVEVFRSWAYTFHIRQAETWSAGRVFLAGDAAHIMPPFAGQGVSSGVRDVANLCWKLDAVLTAGADPALLATYEAERRANVDRLTFFSVTIGRIVMTRNDVLARMRDAGFRASAHVPGLGGAVRSMRMKPRYRLATKGGFFSRRARVRSARGQFVEQPWVVGADHVPVRLDTLLGTSWAWLGFAESPIPRVLADAGVIEIRLVSAHALASHRVPPGHWIDSEGVLERRMRRVRVRGLLVRPDRFVFGGDRELTAEDLRRVAATVRSPSATPPSTHAAAGAVPR